MINAKQTNRHDEDKLGARLKSITNEIKLYLEKRIELTLIGVWEQVSGMLAQTIHITAGFALLLVSLIFLFTALAIYLGNLVDSEALGYVLVSVPIIITGFLFLSLKPASLTEKIQNYFEQEILKALKKDDEDLKTDMKLPPAENESKEKQTV